MKKVSSDFWYCERRYVGLVLNECLVKCSRYKKIVIYGDIEEIEYVKNTAYIVVKRNYSSKTEFKIIIKVCF